MQGLPKSFKVPYDPGLRAGSLVVGGEAQQTFVFSICGRNVSCYSCDPLGLLDRFCYISKS